MSELKWNSLKLVSTVLIAGTFIFPSQGRPRPQPPGYTAQQERERTDAAVRRMNEPDAQRERQLCDRLQRVLLQYRADKSPSSCGECETLLDTILALPKPTARAYSLCASTASVLGRPRQAIEIVKKAVAEYPDERIEGPDVPLKVSGRYRIAAIATRIGDANEATQAYETILGNTDDLKWREVHDSLCRLHLADIAWRIAGNSGTATERLRQATKILEDAMGESHDRQNVLAINLMKDWIRHELSRLEHGKVDPNSAADSATIHSDGVLLVVMMGALLSCPSQPESEQMAESDRPSIQRDLAGLALAIDCMHRSNPFRAEGYLRRIAESDSYFKSYAGTMLAFTHENMKKIREQIPSLLTDLTASDENRRERAAFRLLYECGSEGIKVLDDAQNDPNKYVRYIAACTLANQSYDRSIKPRFDIVLDALADDDPRIRRKAQSAVGQRSCLDIGSEEIVALIRLMNEHHSAELARTVKEALSPARMNAQIMEVAMLELISLADRGSEEALNAVLEILARIGPAPAQATSALTRRLDKARDQGVQTRIIGILGQMGPAAQDAVPALAKYVHHNNRDVRNAAIFALKRISPPSLGQLKPAHGP